MMVKEQLTKAFQLMKDGEKGQALVIVKGILREDPRNVNAWWMMSHLLEDEDKVVKSLEKVLSLDPNHQVARKKLAKLRPEYSNLVSEEANASKILKKESAKSNDDYWAKLNQGSKPASSGSSIFRVLGAVAFSFGGRLIIALIIIAISGIGAFIANIESEKALPDINGNTPQDAVQTFIYADAVQDVDLLYSISCPAIHNYVDSIVRQFSDYYPAENVDFSETVFELEHHDYRSDRAYVILSGVTQYSGRGMTTAFDWREAAAADGYNFYGEFVHKIDGRWLVCTEYVVPNVDHESYEE